MNSVEISPRKSVARLGTVRVPLALHLGPLSTTWQSRRRRCTGQNTARSSYDCGCRFRTPTYACFTSMSKQRGPLTAHPHRHFDPRMRICTARALSRTLLLSSPRTLFQQAQAYLQFLSSRAGYREYSRTRCPFRFEIRSSCHAIEGFGSFQRSDELAKMYRRCGLASS